MAAPSAAAETFRFLDLPPELRLMVYENLSYGVNHHRVPIYSTSDPSKIPDEYRMILVIHHFPTSILSTCKLIYTEAKPFFRKLIESHGLSQTPKIILNGSRRSFYSLEFDELLEVINKTYKLALDTSIDSKLDVSHIVQVVRPELELLHHPRVKTFIAQAAHQLVYAGLSPAIEVVTASTDNTLGIQRLNYVLWHNMSHNFNITLTGVGFFPCATSCTLRRDEVPSPFIVSSTQTAFMGAWRFRMPRIKVLGQMDRTDWENEWLEWKS